MAKRGRKSPRRWFSTRRHRRGKTKIPLAPIIGLAGTVLGGKGETTLSLIQGGNFAGALYRTCINFTGYDPATGNWNWQSMNLEPLLVGCAVHWAAGKFGLNRAIRKIPAVNI
jgi:hypothetical protein